MDNMVVRTFRNLSLALFITFLTGCGKTKTSQPEGPIDFERDIQPIFNQSCALSGCHSGPNPTGNMSLEEGVSYQNIVKVVSFGYAPALRVYPGFPDSSVLYHKVSYSGRYGQGMPPTAPLPSDEVQLIKQWIKELGQDTTTYTASYPER